MSYTKAIVTGGAGFIGSHIVDELIARGIATISIDNYLAGREENLEHLRGNPLFTEARCDVLDTEAVDKLMDGVDIIFHNAASKKTVCFIDPCRDIDVNGKGTLNMLMLAHKHKVKKFVHASTSSIFGNPLYDPQDEAHPVNPASFYGVSKLAGEKYVRAFHELYGMDTSILRYFHVYGTRQGGSNVEGVASIFIRNILNREPIVIYGSGKQERALTCVNDLVDANMRCAEKGKPGEAYNCASSRIVTIKELADIVRRMMNDKSHKIIYKDWTPGDVKHYCVSNEKVKRELGAQMSTDIEDGIAELVEWWKNLYADKERYGRYTKCYLA